MSDSAILLLMNRFLLSLSLFAVTASSQAQPKGAPDFPEGLAPKMLVKAQLVFEHSFESTEPEIDKTWLNPRQATRWTIEDGMLVGIESSREIQAKRSHHKGTEPRVAFPRVVGEGVVAFSVCFLGGKESSVVPFAEFGHHVTRLTFSSAENSPSARVLTDYESQQTTTETDWTYQPGEWLHVMMEIKGDEALVQIHNGPTFYVQDKWIAYPAPAGANGLGLAGTTGGRVLVDHLRFWLAAEEKAEGWPAARKALPKMMTRQVKEKSAKEKAKQDALLQN